MEKTYDTYDDEEIEIDLREILFALRAKLWAIILALIIGGGLAAIYSKVVLTPQYTSTSMVYVLSKETTLTSLADLQIGSQLTKDYKVVVVSRPVLQEVIDTLKLDMDYIELKKRLVIENQADTRILSISIEDPDPVRAKSIVDSVAKISSRHIGDIMEMIPPKIIEEGIVSTEKSSPHTTKNTLLGGLAFAFLVAGLVVLGVVLNDTIRSEDDVEKYLHLSILASVPEREEDRASHGKNGKRRKKKEKTKAEGGNRH